VAVPAGPDPGRRSHHRILQERAIRRGETVNDQLQAALNSRVVIEQANGVVAERAQLRMDEAFTRPKEQPVPVRRRPARRARELDRPHSLTRQT
jgi:hypothetical protein